MNKSGGQPEIASPPSFSLDTTVKQNPYAEIKTGIPDIEEQIKEIAEEILNQGQKFNTMKIKEAFGIPMNLIAKALQGGHIRCYTHDMLTVGEVTRLVCYKRILGFNNRGFAVNLSPEQKKQLDKLIRVTVASMLKSKRQKTASRQENHCKS